MTGQFEKELEGEIPKLQRYARSLMQQSSSAEDLVQQCLERAIQCRHQFEAGTNLRAWLFTILHNLHIDDCRRKKRSGVDVPLEDHVYRLGQSPTQHLHLEVQDVRRCMRQLEHQDAAILMMVGVYGMKYTDIARQLDVAVGTVKSRLNRARTKLRRLMEVPAAGSRRSAAQVLRSTIGTVAPIRRGLAYP